MDSQEQPTWGKGLAENSILPAKVGELIAAMTDNGDSYGVAGYRDLPMSRHDERAMTHPRVREAFEKFVQQKRELFELLEQTAERDDHLLEIIRVHNL